MDEGATSKQQAAGRHGTRPRVCRLVAAAFLLLAPELSDGLEVLEVAVHVVDEDAAE
jgi:hypothetical protein